MKLQAINGLSFKSQCPISINPYLYTYNNEYNAKSHFSEHKAQYISGLLALGVALFALVRIGRSAIPKECVELTDMNVGLNAIKDAPELVKQIKNVILYPMMCVKLGQKGVKNQSRFKTGLILGAKNSEDAQRFIDKFMEHASKLDIKTVKLKNPSKANRISAVHKTIDEAIKLHEKEKCCVIVDIGDLAKISNMSVSKLKCQSKLEKRLAQMPKGVLWSAWTTEYENLPYFYNNLPTLCTKL